MQITIESLFPGCGQKVTREDILSSLRLGDCMQYNDTGTARRAFSSQETVVLSEGQPDWAKDRVVIDLGAGRNPWGYRVAALLGASAYVAVEPYGYDELLQILRREGGELPWFVTDEDAKTLLQRLPDALNIACFGFAFDQCIVQNWDYLTEVAIQVGRVMAPGGAVFALNCEIPFGNGFTQVNLGILKDLYHRV